MNPTAKNYTVILNDHNKTVIYTNSLTMITRSGRKVNKYPPTARIIDNSTVVLDKPEVKEKGNTIIAIDTTPCKEWQSFVSEMSALEDWFVKELGFEFRRTAIVF